MLRIGCFGDSLTAGRPGSAYFKRLQVALPGDTLLNFGVGNDSVISLSRRIANIRFERPLDIAFLWIGVNDVPRSDGRVDRAFNSLLGQRRSRDSQEFLECYRTTLELLSPRASRIIAAPPVLKGEDLGNRWNRRLGELAGLIRDATTGEDVVDFLDLRAAFIQTLAGKPISDYLPGNPLSIILDTLSLRSDSQVDAKAKERGLHLTLDGVHLNSAGAGLVARELIKAIHDSAWKPGF